jgi:hypothetical protein
VLSADDILQRARALTNGRLGPIAEKLRISKSQVSRLLNGARPSVQTCIGLADMLELLPHDVLRAWSYSTEANWMERANRRRQEAQAGQAPMPAGHTEVHEELERLTPEAFAAVATVIRLFAQQPDAPQGKRQKKR